MKKYYTYQYISNYSTGFIFTFFILFTIFSVLISLYIGDYGGDLLSLGMRINKDFLIYTLFEVLCVNFCFLLFFITINKFIIIKKGFINPVVTNNYIHILFTVIIIFTLIITNLTSVGSIIRDGNSNRTIELIFALIQPFYLSIIYLYVFFNSKSKVFKLNFILLFVNLILSGFVGYILFIIPFMLKWYTRKFSLKSIIIILPLLLVCLPFLHVLKFLIKYNMSFIEMYHWLDLEKILAFSRSIVDRFSYIPNTIFIKEHADYFYNFIHQPHNYPIFQGYIGSIIEKSIISTPVGNINGELSSLLYGQSSSNSTFSLLSYFHVDIIYGILTLIYSLLLATILKILISILIVTKREDNYMSYLFFIPTYLYLLQGWYWPFMNFIQAIIIFIIVGVLFKSKNRYIYTNLT